MYHHNLRKSQLLEKRELQQENIKLREEVKRLKSQLQELQEELERIEISKIEILD